MGKTKDCLFNFDKNVASISSGYEFYHLQTDVFYLLIVDGDWSLEDCPDGTLLVLTTGQ